MATGNEYNLEQLEAIARELAELRGLEKITWSLVVTGRGASLKVKGTRNDGLRDVICKELQG